MTTDRTLHHRGVKQADRPAFLPCPALSFPAQAEPEGDPSTDRNREKKMSMRRHTNCRAAWIGRGWHQHPSQPVRFCRHSHSQASWGDCECNGLKKPGGTENARIQLVTRCGFGARWLAATVTATATAASLHLCATCLPVASWSLQPDSPPLSVLVPPSIPHQSLVSPAI